MELVPADGEDVKLVAEEDSVKDAAGVFTDTPAVEAAEVVHGDIVVVVMGDVIEGQGRRFPQRPEEVGDLLAMEIDKKDEERHSNKEHQQGLEIEPPKRTT